jgi:hypothetical protein
MVGTGSWGAGVEVLVELMVLVDGRQRGDVGGIVGCEGCCWAVGVGRCHVVCVGGRGDFDWFVGVSTGGRWGSVLERGAQSCDSSGLVDCLGASRAGDVGAVS